MKNNRFDIYIDPIDKILANICDMGSATDSEIKAKFSTIEEKSIDKCIIFLECERLITTEERGNDTICTATIKGILYINEGGKKGELKRNRITRYLYNISLISTIVYALLTFLMLYFSVFSDKKEVEESVQAPTCICKIGYLDNTPPARS